MFCLQVWAVDQNIAYSNQVAMTQMLLLMTEGTVDWLFNSISDGEREMVWERNWRKLMTVYMFCQKKKSVNI